ncbi:MAG: hypothetical protein HOV80_01235 [Polyangiaceae bacterium]|nr:hypothetical protein [Polyangiaceae bacterium]
MSRPDRLRLEMGRVLVHPFWLASLALLVINDHLLKGSGLLPGWVTGKLSDFAGLFVAPALLGVLTRVKSRHALVLVHVAVGVGFAAFELSSELAAAADVGYRVAGFRWQQWSDPTDLLALFVLPLAFAFALRVARRDRPTPQGALYRILASAGLVACAASTGDPVEVGPEDGLLAPDCSEQEGTVYDPETGSGIQCEPGNTEDACDNGVDDDGDGLIDCDDSDCIEQCADLRAACSALPLPPATMPTMLTGSTLGKPSLTESNCMGADAPEAIFLVLIDVPGTLTVDVPANHGISVRRDCVDWRTEDFCSDVPGPTEIAFENAGSVYLVVEALDPLSAADFEMPISFQSE